MDPVVVVAGVALLLIGLEQVAPSHRQPRVRGWIARVVLLNLAQVAVVYLGTVTWDHWFPRLRVWDGESHGTLIGIAIGYLAITFVYYWWHRARHEIPMLWRWLHQIHHSPVRIEVVTSFYKHPLEILINGALSSFVLHVGVGLSAANAAIVVTITGITELLYHSNLRTPYWLGFIFQRPESHRRHHERTHHRDNYSDLPLWDILFGTFDNPRVSPQDCGFSKDREIQLLRMLIGKHPR